MKTAIILLTLAGLLFAGTATASDLEQSQPDTDGKIACSPLVYPVCYTYYYYCTRYLRFCPVQ